MQVACADKNKKLWAELLEAMAGDAKLIAMNCPKGDGMAVLQKLKERYGKLSAAKLCTRITNFANSTKQGKYTVESHNTKWAEELRQLELQGMPLPKMFQCCLYLMSLGPRYSVFTAVAAMGNVHR
jgi:hypothetical protein